MKKEHSFDTLSLEELIAQVSDALSQLGLNALPDRRASLMPDVRMVRYYTSLGLLRPPTIVQRQARYDAQHVDSLLLIKLLQLQGLSLARIQQELPGLSFEQRRAWLERLRTQALNHKQDESAQTSVAALWQEFVLAPGLRLQLREDYACPSLANVLRQVEALLAPLQTTPPQARPTAPQAPAIEQTSPAPGLTTEI